MLLLEESSYLSISNSFSSIDKRNRLSSRLNAWWESLSLKVEFLKLFFYSKGRVHDMKCNTD